MDEQTVMEMVDLFPTFCAIAHAPLPAGFDFNGEDMAAAFDNQATVHAKTIFWEYGRKSKLFHYPGPVYDRSPHLAVRDGKWKLLVNADGSHAELYDLATDRNETNNVADANAELAKQLGDAALAWKKSLPRLIE